MRLSKDEDRDEREWAQFQHTRLYCSWLSELLKKFPGKKLKRELIFIHLQCFLGRLNGETKKSLHCWVNSAFHLRRDTHCTAPTRQLQKAFPLSHSEQHYSLHFLNIKIQSIYFSRFLFKIGTVPMFFQSAMTASWLYCL